MMVKYEEVEDKIITIRNQHVLLDSDIAWLYGIETKRVNEAVKNNPEKFPDGYLLELNDSEWEEVRSKFSTSPLGGGRAYKPKAFTERGLYMLATILKSSKATETTLAIIDTFTKVRELNRSLVALQTLPLNKQPSKSLLKRTGELMSDLFMSDEDDLETDESETTLEIGMPFMRFKRRIKKSKKDS